EVLGRLRKRAIRRRQAAIPDADRRGRRDRLERLGQDQLSGLVQLLVEGQRRLVERCETLRRERAEDLRVDVDDAEVLHRASPLGCHLVTEWSNGRSEI